MAANPAQLDTTIEVVTPENIAFRYRLAGPFRRLLAYLIDLLIRLALLMAFYQLVVVTLAYVGIPSFGFALFILLAFVVSWFYGGILETFWNGQTVGKRALGIRVLSTDGRPIDALQAVMRNVLREADILPVFILYFVPMPTCLFGLAAVTANRRFQRLGDLACGTMVVTDERTWLTSLTKVDDATAIQLAAVLPPNFVLSRNLREALAGYVERRRYFPAGRRADIARHVGAPLCRRLNLPPNTSHDLLLCALYYRTFVVDEERSSVVHNGSGHAPASGGRAAAVHGSPASRFASVR